MQANSIFCRQLKRCVGMVSWTVCTGVWESEGASSVAGEADDCVDSGDVSSGSSGDDDESGSGRLEEGVETP